MNCPILLNSQIHDLHHKFNKVVNKLSYEALSRNINENNPIVFDEVSKKLKEAEFWHRQFIRNVIDQKIFNHFFLKYENTYLPKGKDREQDWGMRLELDLLGPAEVVCDSLNIQNKVYIDFRHLRNRSTSIGRSKYTMISNATELRETLGECEDGTTNGVSRYWTLSEAHKKDECREDSLQAITELEHHLAIAILSYQS